MSSSEVQMKTVAMPSLSPSSRTGLMSSSAKSSSMKKLYGRPDTYEKDPLLLRKGAPWTATAW